MVYYRGFNICHYENGNMVTDSNYDFAGADIWVEDEPETLDILNNASMTLGITDYDVQDLAMSGDLKALIDKKESQINHGISKEDDDYEWTYYLSGNLNIKCNLDYKTISNNCKLLRNGTIESFDVSTITLNYDYD